MSNNSLPPLWRFDFGDYTQLGSVFQKFLANLNLFTLAIYNIVNGGIGFSNMQRAVYSATITAGSTTPISFVNPLTIAPSGLVLIKIVQLGSVSTALTTTPSVANFIYDGKNINILNIPGLTNGTQYQISIEVM